jgi:tetratricopeptide (TPR) repeat protein
MGRDDKALAARAAKYWEQGDFQALIRLCSARRAARVPQVFYFGGLAFDALNRKREVVECWRKAIALKQDYDAPIRALAHELAGADDLLDAAKLFHDLVRLDKATADDLTALAEICIKQDRLSEARKLLEQALALEPDNSLALLAMATVYIHVRDRELALKYLRQAAALAELDLAELASDPEFEFLWHDPEFQEVIGQPASPNGMTRTAEREG